MSNKHKTGSRESTRIVNKQLSDLWKVPTPEGKEYPWPFQARGACCHPQAPDVRTVSGSGFDLLGVYTPRRVGSQILTWRFPHFPACANSKFQRSGEKHW